MCENSMHWMENIGFEQKDREYKVFMFNPLRISSQDAIKYLSNCKFVFNRSVIETIKNYIQTYLPKYISSYINPKSELNQGCLYFGICDDGNVSGIPYNGTLPIDFINHQIDKVFLKLLKFSSSDLKNEIRSFVSVELINVNKSKLLEKIQKNKTNPNPNPNPNPIYSKYLQELAKIKSTHELYEKKRNVWEKMCDTNILKLRDMINDSETRDLIWEYAKAKSKYSKKAFKNKYSEIEKYCDVDDYWTLMGKIKSGYQFESVDPIAITDIKSDTLNIYYWVTKWKDSKINTLKLVKPKIPKKTIDSNYPIFLLSQSTKMIPQWIETNRGLNLYVIKITINIKKPYTIEYKDMENKWKKSYRIVKNGEPMSLTFKM